MDVRSHGNKIIAKWSNEIIIIKDSAPLGVILTGDWRQVHLLQGVVPPLAPPRPFVGVFPVVVPVLVRKVRTVVQVGLLEGITTGLSEDGTFI